MKFCSIAIGLVSLGAVCAVGGLLRAAGPSGGLPQIDFVRDIQPILRRHCQRCHGSKNQEGGLQLNRRASAYGAGDSAEPIIVEGRADESLLVKRIAGDDEGDRMPLDGPPLSEEEIGLLRRWIDVGAPWPAEAAEPIHWAYQPIARPRIPETKQNNGAFSPIDYFIRRRLDETGIEPSPQANRSRLIRRVSLALVGLPPTPEEVEAFVSDPSDNAYANMVDRLLDSPRYGERWAVHWLDLARYADSNGFQADQLRENWAYRDWVIRALNADMPYDQFVIDQLAGDLRPVATADQRIATGFHRMTTCNVEAGVDPEVNRMNQIVDRVNTTATVFLGTTLECAQCHDHKYDPFTQKDYYRFFAYFNNTQLEVKHTKGVTWDFFGPKLDLPVDETVQRERHERQEELEKLQSQQQELASRSDADFDQWIAAIRQGYRDGRTSQEFEKPESTGDRSVQEFSKEVIQLALKESHDEADRQKLRDQFEQHNPRLQQLDERIADLTRKIDELKPPTTLVMEELAEPRDTFVLSRGDYESPTEKVTPGTLQALPRAIGIEATGDRLELARWLTAPENPLLARVTVNRWWGEVFGAGIVRTAEDFGTQADDPSHPQLLDWLAAELIDSGWSMKHIHKLIVMSATFRQSAKISGELLSADPENRLLARGPRFRLPAELIRDNALAISGLLSTAMYGPPIMPYQPAGIWRSVGRNQPEWNAAEDENRFRRGVYVVWKRAAPYPSFVNFDAPDRSSCTVNRPRTNTPLQALTLLNDPAYAEMALAFADRVLSESPASNDEAKIDYALQLALSRSGTLREIELLEQLLEDQREMLAASSQMVEARTNASCAAMRLKTEDHTELAAWFAVTNALLNLDETVTN